MRSNSSRRVSSTSMSFQAAAARGRMVAARPFPPAWYLLRLREEHQHARTAFGLELKRFFVRPVRHGEAVARLVVSRLAIHQQHIVMRLVAGNVVHDRVPRPALAVALERHRTPMIE